MKRHIQLNLLPDVKTAYLHAKRTRQIAVMSSLAVAVVSVLVVALIFSLLLFQGRQMKGLDDDIASETSKVRAIEDLDKLLTVQNQLGALSDLHEQKPSSSRLFTYLAQVVPLNIKLQSAAIDTTDFKIALTGSSANLESINIFADTLKFTTYKSGDDGEELPAFSAIVTSSSRSQSSTNFSVTFTYDETLFDNTADKITLNVPKQVTTRSVSEQPLFEEKPEQDQGGTQ